MDEDLLMAGSIRPERSQSPAEKHATRGRAAAEQARGAAPDPTAAHLLRLQNHQRIAEMDDVIRGRLNIEDGPDVARTASAMRAQAQYTVTHVEEPRVNDPAGAGAAEGARLRGQNVSLMQAHQLRKLSDDRFLQAWVRCPDDGAILIPTGDAYAAAEDAASPRMWSLAFRCALHDDEILRIWRPELEALIVEVLRDADVEALPTVGPNLR